MEDFLNLNSFSRLNQQQNQNFDPYAIFDPASQYQSNSQWNFNSPLSFGSEQSSPSLAPGADNPFLSLGNFAKGANIASNLGNVFLGYKQSKLAKEQLDFQKQAFLSQFNMQVEDRAKSEARAKASATGVSRYSQ